MEQLFAYVTVYEFLQHGGVLKLEREIFVQDYETKIFKQSGTFGGIHEDWAVKVQKTHGTFCLNQCITFVKIKVKPVWK